MIPPDTEVRFISFGGEEAGLRGSRRYVERHLDDLRQPDARDLNMEMIAHPEITILTSEKSGTVMVAFYHQKWDRPEVLTTEPLLDVLRVAVEWVRHGGE